MIKGDKAKDVKAALAGVVKAAEAQRGPFFHHPGCKAFTSRKPEDCACVGGEIDRALRRLEEARRVQAR